MSEDKKVPEIRFAGFTDAWEQRKLGEVGTTYTGLSGKTKEDFGHGNGQFVTYMNVFSNPVGLPDMTEAVELDDSQNKVLFGDVLFTTSSETPEEVGMSSVWLENAENTYLNSFCFGYRPTVEFSPYYLAYMLRSSSMRKKITFLAQGISRYNISKNKMMDIEIPIPNIEEQKQIGAYFHDLDHLITLHQRKHDKLVVLKQAMLEKMFPQGGSNVPEVRFTGFTDPWEQRKFGDDLISIQTGTNKLGSENGKGTPLLKMGNIQRGYFSLDKIEYLSDGDDVEPENIAYYGDFFFNTRNTLELVGKGATWTGNSGEYAFNSNIARFKLRELDTIFFNYLYNTRSMIEQVHARAMGTTSVAAIYPQSLKSIEYYVPTMAEQQRIGELLLKIDNLITLHHRKHESLKHIKAALLQKMFV